MRNRLTTVTLFCGAGGADIGKAAALRDLGLEADVLAIDYWKDAVDTYAANFPEARALCADLLTTTADDVGLGGQRIDFLWASPSCVNHSRARMARRAKVAEDRDQAWPVLRGWIARADVQVIMLENVIEFEKWGPLDEGGKPIKARRGETFREWLQALRDLGYEVEYRTVCMADYGGPTTRRRLFLQARKDGQRIVWPSPTHRDPRVQVPQADLFVDSLPAWRSAAECIDWSIGTKSIFFGRKKPLAHATLRRIANGMDRYVLGAARPFIMHVTHGARAHSVDAPLPTVTAAPRGEMAAVAPLLVQTGYSEAKRKNGTRQAVRVLDSHAPLGTIVQGGGKHALVTGFLAKQFGGENAPGAPKCVGSALDMPMDTVMGRSRSSVVAATLVTMRGTSDRQIAASGLAADGPMGTVSSGGGHHALVEAFLVHYYGQGTSSPLSDPMDTVTTKDRHGLVVVMVDGESFAVADIGMRMLEPRELARAMSWPDTFVLPKSKTKATRMIGNGCEAEAVRAHVREALRPLVRT